MPLRAAVIAAALAAVLASQSGCSIIAAGFASENHLGGCMDSGAPGGVDIVLGVLGAAALVSSGKVDHSTALLALPGAFVATGVTQMIFADRCRERTNGESHAAYVYYPAPAPPPAPALAPDQRDATPEEMGIVPPPANLALPPSYALPPPPADAGAD